MQYVTEKMMLLIQLKNFTIAIISIKERLYNRKYFM